MLEVAMLVALFAVQAADLPPGAVLRLGDDRWRAGDTIWQIQFSPDSETLSAWVGTRWKLRQELQWQ
jgi:hypothetical protein